MASFGLDKKDMFQVHAEPVATPFTDIDDPYNDMPFNADVPLPSIERPYTTTFVLDPPSPSSNSRYTTSSHRRTSQHTQLTEPSLISDMPSDTFSLRRHHHSKTAMSSPAISPGTKPPRRKNRNPTSDQLSNGSAAQWQHHPNRSSPRPSLPRHHTTTGIQTPPPPTQKPPPPLVLLHITLLPPPTPPFPLSVMEAVLPPHILAAYRALEAKLADPVLMHRGILVAHPRDEYDVLEERVLESLDLVAPRVLKCGHFNSEWADRQWQRRDSGGGANVDEDEEEEEEEWCPECGDHVARLPAPKPARWTVKIYAANGLMRAGAWAAAWSEMERVDVEVAPWVGEAQMRALRRRVAEEEGAARRAAVVEEEEREQEVREGREEGRRAAEREAEVRAEGVERERVRLMAEAEERAERERLRLIGSAALAAAAERRVAAERVEEAVRAERRRVRDEAARRRAEKAAAKKEVIPLGTLLANYVYVLATDRRNVLIVLLTALVAFLSMQVVVPSAELDVLSFSTPVLDNATIVEVGTHTTTTATVTAFILEPSTIASALGSPSASLCPSSDAADSVPAHVVEEAEIASSAQTEAAGSPQPQPKGAAIIHASPDHEDSAVDPVTHHIFSSPTLQKEDQPTTDDDDLSSSAAATAATEADTMAPEQNPNSTREETTPATIDQTAAFPDDATDMYIPIHLDESSSTSPLEVASLHHPFCHPAENTEPDEQKEALLLFQNDEQYCARDETTNSLFEKASCSSSTIDEMWDFPADMERSYCAVAEAFVEAVLQLEVCGVDEAPAAVAVAVEDGEDDGGVEERGEDLLDGGVCGWLSPLRDLEAGEIEVVLDV